MRIAASFVASFSLVAVGANVALAADLVKPRVVAPVVVPAPVAYDWHGCYVGGIVGYGWGNSHWIDPPPSSVGEFSHDHPKGWLAGGELGCNLSHGALVLGIEGDFAWANIRDAQHHKTGDPDEWTDTTTIHSVGSIAGRLGIAHDRTLWFVKAGWAAARVTFDDTGFNPSNPLPAGYHYATTDTRGGYLLGAGVEYAWHDHWTVKLEFDYMNFGTRRTTLAGIITKPFQPTETFISKLDLSVLKLGVNYKF